MPTRHRGSFLEESNDVPALELAPKDHIAVGAKRMNVTFDASAWFNEVDPESIMHLAQQGWSGASVAEALQHRSGNERLRELIQYAAERLEEETLEDPTWSTFECIVNGSEALEWLDAYRPAVAAKIREAR